MLFSYLKEIRRRYTFMAVVVQNDIGQTKYLLFLLGLYIYRAWFDEEKSKETQKQD
jgi:hypothetical protein